MLACVCCLFCLSYFCLLKMGNVSTIPRVSSLKHILGEWLQLWTQDWEEGFHCNNVWQQYLVGSQQEIEVLLPWDRVHLVLSPLLVKYIICGFLCPWCGSSSAPRSHVALGLMFPVLCKTLRPNLRVNLGFSVWSSGFSFCLDTIFYLQTNVKWRKATTATTKNLSVLVWKQDILREKIKFPSGS